MKAEEVITADEQNRAVTDAMIKTFQWQFSHLLDEFCKDMRSACIDRIDMAISEIKGDEAAYVYFIRMVGTNRVKIGKAINPKKRMSAFQTGCGVELELVLTLPFKSEAAAYEAEKILHWYFNDCRVKVDVGSRNKRKTEWFEFSDDMFPLDEEKMRAILWEKTTFTEADRKFYTELFSVPD